MNRIPLDIKKHFSVAPQSQLVKQYAPVTFRCEPPAAAPFAQLYWLKNGAPISIDDNVQVSKEGDLLIKQASLLVSVKILINLTIEGQSGDVHLSAMIVN